MDRYDYECPFAMSLDLPFDENGRGKLQEIQSKAYEGPLDLSLAVSDFANVQCNDALWWEWDPFVGDINEYSKGGLWTDRPLTGV